MEASAKLKNLRNFVLRLNPENLQGMKRRVENMQRRIQLQQRQEFEEDLPYPEDPKERAKAFLDFHDRCDAEAKRLCHVSGRHI